mmetsp:Transcript_6954/g.15911  ORF Transcript_6954/g.15911 Transcript_6954/m.15911 type:complete len:201 (-) Transcript_6954:595-1197(-)
MAFHGMMDIRGHPFQRTSAIDTHISTVISQHSLGQARKETGMISHHAHRLLCIVACQIEERLCSIDARFIHRVIRHDAAKTLQDFPITKRRHALGVTHNTGEREHGSRSIPTSKGRLVLDQLHQRLQHATMLHHHFLICVFVGKVHNHNGCMLSCLLGGVTLCHGGNGIQQTRVCCNLGFVFFCTREVDNRCNGIDAGRC